MGNFLNNVPINKALVFGNAGINLNKPPRYGHGYIYAIKHYRVSKGDMSKAYTVTSGEYIGLTTRSINDRWRGHLSKARSQNWKPSGDPLYTAIRTGIGKDNQHNPERLDRLYFQRVGLGEFNLLELADKEAYFIENRKKYNNQNVGRYKDLIRRETYNKSAGREGDPLSRVTSQVEIIIAGHYYFLEHPKEYENYLEWEKINKKIEKIKKEHPGYLKIKTPGQVVIERVLKRFGQVGTLLNLAFRNGTMIRRLTEQIFLERVLLAKNDKNFSIFVDRATKGGFALNELGKHRDEFLKEVTPIIVKIDLDKKVKELNDSQKK